MSGRIACVHGGLQITVLCAGPADSYGMTYWVSTVLLLPHKQAGS